MKLVATYVVRNSRRGESHGGVYLVDLERRKVSHPLEGRPSDVDLQADSEDRGLRGIAIDGDTVYIAASDELLAYTPDFKLVDSWRNPYLRHCHETAIYERTLYLTSTACDSILGFDLDERRFCWAMQVATKDYRFAARRFDPRGDDGPLPINKLHLNSVHCNAEGMYLGGLRTGGMLHFNGTSIHMAAQLAGGTHNLRPFRDGVLFNDSETGTLRYVGRGEGTEDRAMQVPISDPATLAHADPDDNETVRQGFPRGLCILSRSVVAGGSSPATVTVYDLAANRQLLSVNLTRDVRCAIHGLETWPFD